MPLRGGGTLAGFSRRSRRHPPAGPGGCLIRYSCRSISGGAGLVQMVPGPDCRSGRGHQDATAGSMARSIKFPQFGLVSSVQSTRNQQLKPGDSRFPVHQVSAADPDFVRSASAARAEGGKSWSASRKPGPRCCATRIVSDRPGTPGPQASRLPRIHRSIGTPAIDAWYSASMVRLIDDRVALDLDPRGQPLAHQPHLLVDPLDQAGPQASRRDEQPVIVRCAGCSR